MASRTPPSDALAAWLPRQRWFASKTRRIERVEVEDWVPIAAGGLAVVVAALDDGALERYAVPLLSGGTVSDALDDPGFCRALLDLIAANGTARGDAGEVKGTRTSAFPAELPADLTPRRLAAEQSNTSVAFGDTLMLKHFRLLQPGANPDQEISRFLTERTSFRATPPLAGDLEYRPRSGDPASLAIVQELIPDATDGWRWMLSELERFFDRARAHSGRADGEGVVRMAGPTLAAFRELGTRTAELHLALASDASDPAFAPEPITAADLAGWADGVRKQIDAARRALGPGNGVPATELFASDAGAPAPGRPSAHQTMPDVAGALSGLAGRWKIRHHGDFHLGQTLRRREGGFAIIDFEGEPARPLEERRRKHAALRDVAGMLRSIDYAAASALRNVVGGGAAGEPNRGIPDSAKRVGGAAEGEPSPRILMFVPPSAPPEPSPRIPDSAKRDEWAAAWVHEAGATYVAAYRHTAGAAPFLPVSSDAFDRAVAAFVLEKAAYEVVYEANNRPDWIEIPARGLARAAEALTTR